MTTRKKKDTTHPASTSPPSNGETVAAFRLLVTQEEDRLRQLFEERRRLGYGRGARRDAAPQVLKDAIRKATAELRVAKDALTRAQRKHVS